ncbi:subtilase family protein [Clostridium sp. IBUN22A]|uniref:S8 family peptidase n=1 Tax=unclassified Clostridium TaxID=2614128 RepID=UPI0005FC114D|nr:MULTISPECIES: S8 family peptidase [unclassified Clostridium]KJZ84681.1 Ser-type protease [Clostridium sp. IBUN125C]KJZ92774.1 subtilase family protein [Clostridium sp. IBUN22A]KJZ93183.1 subtilase family protein [Clostridium sp. IBUN62F]
MANLEHNATSKTDASIGLLANVPRSILNRIYGKLNIQTYGEEKIELTILYRYTSQSAKDLVESLGGEFYDLNFNFALVYLPIIKLKDLATSSEIQYMELPKGLIESDLESNREACVLQTYSSYNISGKGVIVGFIDSGIDYMHPAFMDEKGNTRIEYIYDLSDGNKTYDKNEIDRAIKSENPYSIVPQQDLTGHGTHVAGEACGGGKIPARYRGVAPESSIIMVKGSRGKWVLSSQIMVGLKFLLDKSKELDMPIVVNISLSTNDGAHNGTSLLEQYISAIANLERVTIVIAAGNEGDAGHHAGGEFQKIQSRSFTVASDESMIVINIYKSILPDITINIIGPTGQQSGYIKISQGYFNGNIGRDRFDIYVSGPKPFGLESEIQIIITSISSDYLIPGTWSIELDVINDYEGSYSIWLPISEGLNPETKFLDSNQFNTLGIPATVRNIIAVGSYNGRTNTLSSYSGRGEQVSCTQLIRPDIVAPGENVIGPLPGGGYDTKTGTSMATPIVAGICALFNEWGIIKGNNPYLFGQRLKYYLVKGAQRSRSDISYPNPSWGYGTICANESFFILENDLNILMSRNLNRDNELGIESSSNNYMETNDVAKNVSAAINVLNNAVKNENIDPDEIIGLIVQYYTEEDLVEINKLPNTSAISISESYAVVRIPIKEASKLIPYVKEIPNIYNVNLYTLSSLSPVEASGVSLFSNNPYLLLDGTDVIVGILDSGIDYLNKEFMREDDTTRILRIWDQTIEGDKPVENLKLGTEYTESQINEAIKISKEGGDPYSIVPSKDEIGHGTMSAGVIGGRGINPDLLGAAPNCNFVVVKIKPVGDFVLKYGGVSADKVAYGNIELILAIRYLRIMSSKLKKPMVIYFPFGTNTGAHDGTGDMEGVLEAQGRKNGIVAVVGTGNQGDTQTHIEGKFEQDEKMKTIRIKIGKNQKDLNFQIYCQKPDKVEVGIVSPSGEILDKLDVKFRQIEDYKFIYEGTTVTIVYLYPDEYNADETIIIKFKDIREGIWQIRLYGEKIVDGRYWAWLPQRELLDSDTRFFDPTQRTTLTVPATGRGVLATAYYNQDLNSTVSKSGRGYTRDGRIKPDIAAGGVNAIVPKPGGGTTVATGSSVATSVLAGCCALILQWAIINGNDPEVRARKLISYVVRGAKMRQGDIYPNIDWGYGMLDMKNIFDSFRSQKQLKEIRDSIDKDGNPKYIEFSIIRKRVINKLYDEFTKNNLFFRIPR